MRKELEKKHGYGYKEPLILAMLGVGLVWNIENQVRKHEERKEEAKDKEQEEEERQRRRRHEKVRSGTWDPRLEQQSRERRSDRSDHSGTRDSSHYRGDGRERRDSRRPRPEYRDEEARDYRELEYRGYRDQYRDFHNDRRYEDRRDGSVRRSSRRDSF